jgi:hypothetical protein
MQRIAETAHFRLTAFLKRASKTNRNRPSKKPESTVSNKRMVGLPGFEPGSREPKSPSLDQASRQPPIEDRSSKVYFKRFFSSKTEKPSLTLSYGTLEHFWAYKTFVW